MKHDHIKKEYLEPEQVPDNIKSSTNREVSEQLTKHNNLILIQDYAKRYGRSIHEVIELINKGALVGVMKEDRWHVDIHSSNQLNQYSQDKKNRPKSKVNIRLRKQHNSRQYISGSSEIARWILSFLLSIPAGFICYVTAMFALFVLRENMEVGEFIRRILIQFSNGESILILAAICGVIGISIKKWGSSQNSTRQPRLISPAESEIANATINQAEISANKIKHVEFIKKIPELAEIKMKEICEAMGHPIEYTEACFETIDKMIEERRNDERHVVDESVVLGFGSFVGEAIRFLLGGRWEHSEEYGYYITDIGGYGKSYQFYPFLKVKKRLENSDSESIACYYSVIKKNIEERNNIYKPK